MTKEGANQDGPIRRVLVRFRRRYTRSAALDLSAGRLADHPARRARGSSAVMRTQRVRINGAKGNCASVMRRDDMADHSQRRLATKAEDEMVKTRRHHTRSPPGAVSGLAKIREGRSLEERRRDMMREPLRSQSRQSFTTKTNAHTCLFGCAHTRPARPRPRPAAPYSPSAGVAHSCWSRSAMLLLAAAEATWAGDTVHLGRRGQLAQNRGGSGGWRIATLATGTPPPIGPFHRLPLSAAAVQLRRRSCRAPTSPFGCLPPSRLPVPARPCPCSGPFPWPPDLLRSHSRPLLPALAHESLNSLNSPALHIRTPLCCAASSPLPVRWHASPASLTESSPVALCASAWLRCLDLDLPLESLSEPPSLLKTVFDSSRSRFLAFAASPLTPVDPDCPFDLLARDPTVLPPIVVLADRRAAEAN